MLSIKDMVQCLFDTSKCDLNHLTGPKMKRTAAHFAVQANQASVPGYPRFEIVMVLFYIYVTVNLCNLRMSTFPELFS